MKSLTAYLLGAATGAAISVIYLKIRNEEIDFFKKDPVEKWMKSRKTYGKTLKKVLQRNEKGPNGEKLYKDTYGKKFYEDETGNRFYQLIA